MGVTIQFESHRVELAAIYELEHDQDVVEYYDQPPTFKLDYREFSATLHSGGGSWAKAGYFGFLLAGLTLRNSLSHL